MIELKNIDFGYIPQRKIFSDLSLTLEAGHIYGLLGKNGMGKTTLLKIMSGLRFCQKGTVNVFGNEAARRRPEMLSDIYFVTEEMDVPSIKISEFLEIYSPFYPNFSRADFDRYMEQFDLVDKGAKLTQLSHGQKKKVLVSFALATNTKLLIMDEPTNGMDIPSKSAFRKVVASAVTDEKTMIISTHQVRDLQNVIDAVIVLDHGRILLNRDINSICEKLSFKVLDSANYERLSSEGKILYVEDNVMGKVAVCPREDGDFDDDKFDMELLFCAVIANTEMSNSEKINALFGDDSKKNFNGKSQFAEEMENMLNNKN